MNNELDYSQYSYETEIEIIESGNSSSENYQEETVSDDYLSYNEASTDYEEYFEESYHSSPDVARPASVRGSRRESIEVGNTGSSNLDDLGESFLNGSFLSPFTDEVFEEDQGDDAHSTTSNDIVSEYDRNDASDIGQSAKYEADDDGSSHQSSSASSYSAEIKDNSTRRWYQPPKSTPPRRIKTEESSLGISSTSFRSSSYVNGFDNSITSMPQTPTVTESALGEVANSSGSEASEMLSRGGTNPHDRRSPETNRRGKKPQRPSPGRNSHERTNDFQPSVPFTTTRQTDSRQKQPNETRPMSESSSQSTDRMPISENEEPYQTTSKPPMASKKTSKKESREKRKESRPQRRTETPSTQPKPKQRESRQRSPSVSAHSRSTNGGESCPSIAVLGTMSGTGKSVIAAALCRIFTNGGTKCAPFKSQNTGVGISPALLPDLSRRETVYNKISAMVKRNGYKNGTKNGDKSALLVAPSQEQGYGRIGKAQSLQAEACKILPRVEMNPIFFQSRGPNEKNEYMCDMIVMGNPIVRDTYGGISKLVPTMKTMAVGAHKSLASVTGAEVIVIQGAGACSELNLMDGDIVNLPLVRCLQCPWLLVANDDTGGVFAQVIGTKMCVSKQDWDLCAGIIINKVRGDIKYFLHSLKMLEKMVGKRLYAMPFVNDLDPTAIDIERRLAWERKGRKEKDSRSWDNGLKNSPGKKLSVVIVAYPHSTISNDLYPLEKDKRFHIEWRRKRLPKPYPDTIAVILPGSSLPLLDLKWLQDSGWADFVRKHVALGGTVLGLGAGYQMLGREVKLGARSKQGIGLLPISSTSKPAECSFNEPVKGQLYSTSVRIEGFELNCGYSEIISSEKKKLASGRYEGMSPLIAYENGKPEGMRLGRVRGTYLHGILRSAKARVELLAPFPGEVHSSTKDITTEDPLDELAKHLQTCGLDHGTLRKIVFAESKPGQ